MGGRRIPPSSLLVAKRLGKLVIGWWTPLVLPLSAFIVFCWHHTAPTEILLAGKIVQIDSGSSHHGAIDSDGKAYLWGNNTSGQCNVNPKKLCDPKKGTYKVIPNDDCLNEKGELVNIWNHLSLKHIQITRRKLRRDRVVNARQEIEEKEWRAAGNKGKYEESFVEFFCSHIFHSIVTGRHPLFPSLPNASPSPNECALWPQKVSKSCSIP